MNGPGNRTFLAPAEARPVVADNARELGQFSVHECPAQRASGNSRFEYRCWTSLPLFIDMETVSANFDQPPGRGEASGVEVRAESLIREARKDQPDDQSESDHTSF